MSEDPAATAASNNPVLSTLVTAVQAADLVDTLNGDGPFTIFAPTNDAFAKIPAADLQKVLADKEQLSKILTYHVVAGKMTAADLATAGSVKTVEGAELKIGGSATSPKVGDANVVCGDVQVGNGVVHIIDTVLMPPADDSMTDDATGASMPTGPGCAAVPADGAGSFSGMADDPAATAASNNPVLSTLVSAVKAAGLVDTLNGPGPFTIFAPSNDAFAKIPAADLQKVLADKEQLTKILTYHVVPGKMSSADLAKAGTATTVEGGDVKITADGGSPKVNDANVICADVPVGNGVVHIIDTVLMPGS
ncbi:MAG: fasciclin domain-containing protein [Acidimicrobiales bacterium]